MIDGVGSIWRVFGTAQIVEGLVKDAIDPVGRMAVGCDKGITKRKKARDLDRMLRIDRSSLPGYKMIVVVGF